LAVVGHDAAASGEELLFELAPGLDAQNVGDLVQLVVAQIQIVITKALFLLVIANAVDPRKPAHGNLPFILAARLGAGATKFPSQLFKRSYVD